MINTNEADSFIMQLVINISLLPFGYFYFKKLSKKKMIYMWNSSNSFNWCKYYVCSKLCSDLHIYNLLPMHLKSNWTNLVHVWCRSFIPHIWENRSLVAINLFLQFSIKIFNSLNPVVRLIYIPLPLLLLVQNHLPLVK